MPANKNVDIHLRLQGKDRTKKAFKSARRNVDGLAVSAKRLRSAFAALGVAYAASRYASATRGALTFADAIGKTADKIGLSTDALQEYRYAAELSGVAQRQLDLGLQRFSRRTAEALKGMGELRKEYTKEEIAKIQSAKASKRLEVALGIYAEKVKAAEGQQEKLRLSFKAFDSEGAALVNLLGKGSAGVALLRAKAQELGIVMSADLVRAAEGLNDRFTTASRVLDISFKSALVRLSPLLVEFAEVFAKRIPPAVDSAVRAVNYFSDIGTIISTSWRGNISIIVKAIEELIVAWNKANLAALNAMSAAKNPIRYATQGLTGAESAQADEYRARIARGEERIKFYEAELARQRKLNEDAQRGIREGRGLPPGFLNIGGAGGGGGGSAGGDGGAPASVAITGNDAFFNTDTYFPGMDGARDSVLQELTGQALQDQVYFHNKQQEAEKKSREKRLEAEKEADRKAAQAQEEAQEAMQRSVERYSYALADLASAFITGTGEAESFKRVITLLLTEMFASVAGFSAGGPGGAIGSAIVGALGFSKGGVVGAGGGERMQVNPLSMALRQKSIPHFKDGGVLSVLHRGEEVLTPGDPRHARNGGAGGAGGVVNVNVGVFGLKQAAEEWVKSRDGVEALIDALASQPLRVRGAIGLQ